MGDWGWGRRALKTPGSACRGKVSPSLPSLIALPWDSFSIVKFSFSTHLHAFGCAEDDRGALDSRHWHLREAERGLGGGDGGGGGGGGE